jgi:hypothetical protein
LEPKEAVRGLAFLFGLFPKIIVLAGRVLPTLGYIPPRKDDFGLPGMSGVYFFYYFVYPAGLSYILLGESVSSFFF